LAFHETGGIVFILQSSFQLIRFQDTGLRYIHYVDIANKFPVRSGLEDLPERIDVSMISEIATGTCAPPPNVLRDQSDLPTSPLVASPLSFSLLSAHEGSLADQIAPDQSRWADWTDGINMLRRDGGHVASKETAGFVQALTEIGLKIKLLGQWTYVVQLPNRSILPI
jgi:engulfment and cell motility protein 1